MYKNYSLDCLKNGMKKWKTIHNEVVLSQCIETKWNLTEQYVLDVPFQSEKETSNNSIEKKPAQMNN